MERGSALPPRQPKTRVVPPPPHSLSLDRAIESKLIHGRHLDPCLDDKMTRRSILNRQSALRSRMKKLQYVADMERKAKDLEKLVSSLTQKVEVHREKNRLLQLENDSLRAHLHSRVAQSKISQDGIEQRRREITELKEMSGQMGHVEVRPSGSESVPEIPVPQEEMMEGSGVDEDRVWVEEVGPKAYSIEFYEQMLMQMEMKQFIEQELREVEEEEEEVEMEVEVDQYLNLDVL